LAVHADRNGLVIGHRGWRSHEVVAIEQCPVADAALNTVLPLLQPALSRLQGRSQLLELLLVHGLEGVALQCVSKRPLLEKDHSVLTQLAEQLGLCHLSVRVQGHDEGVLLSGEPLLHYPLHHYPLHHDALTMQFAPNDFSQVNPCINQRMVAQAIDALALEPSDRVADLFSGVGNFSLAMAAKGCHVLGIEVSDAMVQKAAANAARNKLNASFEQRDLFVSQNLNLPGVNKILLDPPRAGAEAVCQWLASDEAAAVERVVYVSCNPKTLQRDAQLLLGAGYQLEAATLLDMFPQTTHAEMLLSFCR
jgi:23S rRNA (uracil1939-C5)-methyltransferase